MPVVDGVTATARIRAEHPDTQVVVLTTFADDTNILAALHAGALGYLTKDAGRAQITRALHTAAAGQAVLDPAVHTRLLAAASANTPPPPGRRRAAAGRADRPGSRGPRPDRRRPDQHPNRRPALRHRGHRQNPHQPPVQQDRHARPRAGRQLRLPPPPHQPAAPITRTSPMTAGPGSADLLPPAARDDPREVRADGAQNRANGSEIPPPRRSRTRTHPAGRLKIIPVCGRRPGQESQAKYADRQAVLAQSITRAEAAQLLGSATRPSATASPPATSSASRTAGSGDSRPGNSTPTPPTAGCPESPSYAHTFPADRSP